jgi:hypothetical protein
VLHRGQREALVERGHDGDLRARHELGELGVADAVHEAHPLAQRELGGEALGRAAGRRLADDD